MIDPDHVVAVTAERYGVTVGDVLSDRRRRPLVAVRTEIAVVLRLAGWSLPAIGRVLNRHHTSVWNLLVRDAERHEGAAA